MTRAFTPAALSLAVAFTLGACMTPPSPGAGFTLPATKLAWAVAATTCNTPDAQDGELTLTFACPGSYIAGFSDGACTRLPPLGDDPTLIARCRWSETQRGLHHAHSGYFLSDDGGQSWVYEKRRPR